jgi:hypothetical protein
MTIHPVVAKLFHVDREREREIDMLKLIVSVCKFVNAPKKCFAYKSERKANGKISGRYGKREAEGEAGLLDNKHVRGNISKAGRGGRG